MSKSVSRRKGRRLAVQALYSWDVGNVPVSELVRFSWIDTTDEDDLSFPRLLVQGAVQERETVDTLISGQLEHWDIDRLARVDLAILRIGVYSLRFQPDIPAHVTIDEAVELAKEMSTDEAFRFINGVLDGVRKHLTQ
ncbi:MAG TPA: transcription antitermination factor NusB [Alkalispirochaeta sp.]|nr:transcription antitermination factor NusB [Alkalispirochaeta sp.]